jgi:hypothetical protein
MASAISHDRHLLFIHIPKTGGSAVTFNYLDVFELPDAGVDTHRKIDEFGICPMDYWKFCVVRNPWAMCASWYQWHLLKGDDPAMEVAVDHVEPPERFELDRMDTIIRFERLEGEVKELMTDFGVPDREWKRFNDSGMGDYRPYYTDGLAEVVARRFAESIQRFGYEF